MEHELYLIVGLLTSFIGVTLAVISIFYSKSINKIHIKTKEKNAVSKSINLICKIGKTYIKIYSIILQNANYDQDSYEVTEEEQSKQIDEKLAIYLDENTTYINELIKEANDHAKYIENNYKDNPDLNILKNNLKECSSLLSWVEENFIDNISIGEEIRVGDVHMTSGSLSKNIWGTQRKNFVNNKNNIVDIMERSAIYSED